MDITPLNPTQNTPAAPPSPSHPISSRQGCRFYSDSRGTTPIPGPSEEYEAMTRLLAGVGAVCQLSANCFVGGFYPNVRDFSNGYLAVIPLLSRLVAIMMVQGLGLTVKTLS